MPSELSVDLLRGNLEVMILSTLADGAKYGYLIQQRLGDASRGLINVQAGTLYPILRNTYSGVRDAAPDAVLCNTAVDYIDERGQVFASYASVLGEAGGERPSERFATMVLRSHSCVDMFGLTRRTALESSLLISSFHGADRALLAQLALHGTAAVGQAVVGLLLLPIASRAALRSE